MSFVVRVSWERVKTKEGFKSLVYNVCTSFFCFYSGLPSLAIKNSMNERWLPKTETQHYIAFNTLANHLTNDVEVMFGANSLLFITPYQ